MRLSPTSDPYKNLNPERVARDPKLISNTLPIQEIHFKLLERHNLNQYPLSWKPICEKSSFLYHVVGEDTERIKIPKRGGVNWASLKNLSNL
jgi:hypothetical protein